MGTYLIILFSHCPINTLASSFEEASNVTEQTDKQALPGALENNTIAITE
jgi:hypothetical protein